MTEQSQVPHKMQQQSAIDSQRQLEKSNKELVELRAENANMGK